MTYGDDFGYEDDQMNERLLALEQQLGLAPLDPEAALRGEYGPEAQAEVLSAYGLELEGEDDEQAVTDFLLSNIDAIEARAGRSLSEKEVELAARDLLAGHAPEAVTDAFSDAARGRSRDGDQRRELFTEILNDESALRQEAEDAAGRPLSNAEAAAYQPEPESEGVE
jgi:hypothetical protein